VRVVGRVGWLWCWLGVLVASGCSQQHSLPSPAVQTATLALLSLTQVTIAPTPTLWLFSTPRAGDTPVTLVPTPLNIPLPVPTCYETPVGGITCLGLLRNSLGVPIDQVLLRVYLVSPEGKPLAMQEVHLARRALDPGEMSPYGAVFETIPAGYAGPVVTLVSAFQSRAQTTHLTIRNLQTSVADGVYAVKGIIVSPEAVPLPVERVMVVITLLNNNDQVTGFRQWTWTPDAQVSSATPGTALPFALSIIPQGSSTSHVEASADLLAAVAR